MDSSTNADNIYIDFGEACGKVNHKKRILIDTIYQWVRLGTHPSNHTDLECRNRGRTVKRIVTENFNE